MNDRSYTWVGYIEHEYSIQLTEERASGIAAETERILAIARQLVPQVSFDTEPGEFLVVLLQSRDQQDA
jgi:hypothetical protein